MSKINYPEKLLNIESGLQFTKLEVPIYESDTNLNRVLISKMNQAISEIIELNKKSNGKLHSIEFPKGIREKISDEIKNKVVKNLTAYEIRTFTAIVLLAALAKYESEIYHLPKINRAYFETNLTMIYKAMGLPKSRGKIDKDLAFKALISLGNKRFIYQKNKDFIVGRLVEIHGFGTEKKFTKTTFKITIDSMFCELGEKNNNYFKIPLDLNERLRSVTKGRPNASIEFLIKKLYQSKHCSPNNKVEYGYKTLIGIMNLERHIKNRNHSRIKLTIAKGFKTCKNIGLIDKIEEGKNMYGELKYVIYFLL